MSADDELERKRLREKSPRERQPLVRPGRALTVLGTFPVSRKLFRCLGGSSGQAGLLHSALAAALGPASLARRASLPGPHVQAVNVDPSQGPATMYQYLMTGLLGERLAGLRRFRRLAFVSLERERHVVHESPKLARAVDVMDDEFMEEMERQIEKDLEEEEEGILPEDGGKLSVQLWSALEATSSVACLRFLHFRTSIVHWPAGEDGSRADTQRLPQLRSLTLPLGALPWLGHWAPEGLRRLRVFCSCLSGQGCAGCRSGDGPRELAQLLERLPNLEDLRLSGPLGWECWRSHLSEQCKARLSSQLVRCPFVQPFNKTDREAALRSVAGTLTGVRVLSSEESRLLSSNGYLRHVVALKLRSDGMQSHQPGTGRPADLRMSFPGLESLKSLRHLSVDMQSCSSLPNLSSWYQLRQLPLTGLRIEALAVEKDYRRDGLLVAVLHASPALRSLALSVQDRGQLKVELLETALVEFRLGGRLEELTSLVLRGHPGLADAALRDSDAVPSLTRIFWAFQSPEYWRWTDRRTVSEKEEDGEDLSSFQGLYVGQDASLQLQRHVAGLRSALESEAWVARYRDTKAHLPATSGRIIVQHGMIVRKMNLRFPL